MRPALLVTAAALALSACAVPPASSVPPAPAATSPAPSPAVAVYDNATACTAFHDAVTTGIPPGANVPAGTSTMDWLQSQDGSASPQLRADITAFASAWQQTPPAQGVISRQTRRISRICRST